LSIKILINNNINIRNIKMRMLWIIIKMKSSILTIKIIDIKINNFKRKWMNKKMQ
jgi:hypothetical protein